MAFRLMTPGDVIRVMTDTTEALSTLPESINLMNRSLRSFASTVSRLDGLVQRMDRLTEPLEEPLAALAPRLEALVPLLDEELLASLPPLLAAVQRTGLPALELVGQTQDQVALIAQSVERLVRLSDDTFGRLQDLPGATLVSRLRHGGAKPADKELKEAKELAAGDADDGGARPARSTRSNGRSRSTGTKAPPAAKD